MRQTKVTITGVSGYLGSQVCLSFLSHGSFEVTGTVRSTSNSAKIEPLRTAFGKHFSSLKLVEADLMNTESVIEACSGADIIVHTASPFPFSEPKDENEIIQPAVQGTLAVMEAARRNKVRKVVLTSSLAAVVESTDKTKIHFNETDWSDTEGQMAYPKSKTLAERAAWDFVSGLPENEKFPLVTINPGWIIGPTLTKAKFTSGDAVKNILTGRSPGLPLVRMPTVDVRDCARAHLEAALRSDSNNKRFLMSAEEIWLEDLAMLLSRNYGDEYPVSRGRMRKCLLWLASFFNGEAASMYKVWGMDVEVDTKQTTEVLGIDFISLEKSLCDMVPSLEKGGYL